VRPAGQAGHLGRGCGEAKSAGGTRRWSARTAGGRCPTCHAGERSIAARPGEVGVALEADFVVEAGGLQPAFPDADTPETSRMAAAGMFGGTMLPAGTEQLVAAGGVRIVAVGAFDERGGSGGGRAGSRARSKPRVERGGRAIVEWGRQDGLGGDAVVALQALPRSDGRTAGRRAEGAECETWQARQAASAMDRRARAVRRWWRPGGRVCRLLRLWMLGAPSRAGRDRSCRGRRALGQAQEVAVLGCCAGRGRRCTRVRRGRRAGCGGRPVRPAELAVAVGEARS
jgi:hypothetical protein